MKKIHYLLLCAPLFILPFCTSSSGEKNKEEIKNRNTNFISSGDKSIAVLELFTSQGCSSCPPADRLLGTYASKENVIALSFHVDYWDHLGWKDPYSSKEYTRRQYNYASALHADVYTPELIINGQNVMIGSDENKISSTIKKIFEETPDAFLSIKNIKTANGKAEINFDASGNINKALLNIALIANKKTTQINAGENGGATLTDYNVVENFKTINRIENGNNVATIDIPASADLKNMSIVIFLQQKGNNKITAADEKNAAM